MSIVQFDSKGPSKRSFHKIARIQDKIYVLGGGISAVQYSNQLHLFSFNPNGWTLAIPSVGEKPPQIAGHSLTSHENKIFLFGGRNAIQTSSDFCVLDQNTMEWKISRKLKIPRCYHSATLLPDGKTLFIFGGSSNKGRNEFLNSIDLINTINGDVKTIEGSPEAPAPRMNHGAALVGKKIFIWGGKNSTTNFDDLFYFDTGFIFFFVFFFCNFY